MLSLLASSPLKMSAALSLLVFCVSLDIPGPAREGYVQNRPFMRRDAL